MKLIKRFGALFGFILISSFPAVQAGPLPPASDDFNDDVKSPAWGNDVKISGSNVFLTETNAHLEFTGSTIGDSTILRPWVAGMGSYTQNWEAAVDLYVGNISLSAEGDGISMMLAVADSTDETFGNRMVISMDLDRGWESVEREFYLSSAVAGIESTTFPNSAEVFTGELQGRVRIAFDSFTKTLYGSYNGIPIGSMDVDDAATNWNMTSGSAFAIVLGGSMWTENGGTFTNNSHEVFADNFELRIGNTLAYLLTINNGTGSGAYTNGAKVTITASNAPSGQVFDHWAGSTQYLASVTSAATTVTMPAQVITLNATYKLTGAIAADDFNDNVKDTAKWGDDMVVNGTDAVLQETNGRLEFTNSSDKSAALRPWTYSVGSYTQNWEVAVDVYLGDIVLPSMSGEYVNINLAVVNQQSTNLYNGMFPGDAINIALDLYRDWDGYLIRGYELTSRANAVELRSAPNYGYTSTADVQGRLKIAFDAVTKVLTASYNGNVLGWVDVNASGSNWAMTDSGSFGVAIAGGSGMITVSSGEVYVDNFAMTGAGIPPEDGNSNGLPDWWELQYFGGTVSNPNAVCSNGINTVLEAYIVGLNPNDPDAFFGFTGGDVQTKTLQWSAVSGRVYNVYWTTNLLNSFQPLQTDYTGGTITDSLHSAAGKCFYKIDVRMAQ